MEIFIECFVQQQQNTHSSQAHMEIYQDKYILTNVKNRNYTDMFSDYNGIKLDINNWLQVTEHFRNIGD